MAFVASLSLVLSFGWLCTVMLKPEGWLARGFGAFVFGVTGAAFGGVIGGLAGVGIYAIVLARRPGAIQLRLGLAIQGVACVSTWLIDGALSAQGAGATSASAMVLSLAVLFTVGMQADVAGSRVSLPRVRIDGASQRPSQ